MPHKVEVSTATAASVAATSRSWLPSAEEAVGLAAHPLWADLLAPLGVAWLIIQIGFFLYEKLVKPRKNRKDEK